MVIMRASPLPLPHAEPSFWAILTSPSREMFWAPGIAVQTHEVLPSSFPGTLEGLFVRFFCARRHMQHTAPLPCDRQNRQAFSDDPAFFPELTAIRRGSRRMSHNYLNSMQGFVS